MTDSCPSCSSPLLIVAKTLYHTLLAVYDDVDLTEVNGGSVELSVSVNDALERADKMLMHIRPVTLEVQTFPYDDVLELRSGNGQMVSEGLVDVAAEKSDIPMIFSDTWVASVRLSDDGYRVIIATGETNDDYE